MDIVRAFKTFEVRFVDHPTKKYGFGIIATDMAQVLEHTDPSMMCKPIKDKWKGTSIVCTPGGNQVVVVIWEPGVYQLLNKSRKKNAELFQDWICEDVIPSIRSTGKYEIAPEPKPAILPDHFLSLIDQVFANVPIKPELVAGIKLNAVVEIAPAIAPNALNEARQLLIVNTAQPHELLTATQIGKELGLSGQAINKLLIEKGLQVKNEDRNSSKEPAYLPTVKGSEFADLTLATGSNSSSTFQQLRWYKSVVSALH